MTNGKYQTIDECRTYRDFVSERFRSVNHELEIGRLERHDILTRLYDIQKVIYKSNGIKKRPRPPNINNPTISIPMPGTDKDIKINLGPFATLIIGGSISIYLLLHMFGIV